MSNNDDERFKNFMIYKMFLTNKEMDEMLSSPSFWILLILVILMLIGLAVLL